MADMDKNESSLMDLPHCLKEWTEIDLAATYVGVALGIIPPPSEKDKNLYSYHGKKVSFGLIIQ